MRDVPALPAEMIAARLRLARIMRWVMVADLLIAFGGFALGPPQWSSSAGYQFIHALPIPVPVWGWAGVVAAVLILAGWRTTGHVLAALIFLFWGLALAATVFTIGIVGWGGSFHHVTLAMIHLWLAVVAMWERAAARDRRGR